MDEAETEENNESRLLHEDIGNREIAIDGREETSQNENEIELIEDTENTPPNSPPHKVKSPATKKRKM